MSRETPEFEAQINRFGQQVSAEQQAHRFHQVLDELDRIYGEGETYETVLYDYREVGKGKQKHVERYVKERETVRKVETAKWHAENGY